MADERVVPRRPTDTGVGGGPVKAWVIVVSAVVFFAISLLLLYALWQFWPPSAATPGGQPPAAARFNFLGLHISMSREKNFLVIVAVAGAFGAMGYVLRSFLRYVGDRALLNSWLLLYYLSPLVGAILGTLIYIVLRAGLISGGGVSQTDPYGVAAIAALVGLFSTQAAEKLKQVFEALFTPQVPGHEAATAPTAASSTPGKGEPAAPSPEGGDQ